jgi:hypothetical protein
MLMFAQSMKKIENFIQSLEGEYEFTDDGDIKSYLGIDVSKPAPGTFKLSQHPEHSIVHWRHKKAKFI